MGPFLIAIAVGAWCGRYVSVAVFAMVSFVAVADICITMGVSGVALLSIVFYAAGLIICTQAGYLFGIFTGHWKLSGFHVVRRTGASTGLSTGLPKSAGLDRASLPE